MTDSGNRQPAGGSAASVREQHRTERPASALPDEPAPHTCIRWRSRLSPELLPRGENDIVLVRHPAS